MTSIARKTSTKQSTTIILEKMYFEGSKCHIVCVHILHVDQAGTTVRLFHAEDECYIAAEGSFAEEPAVVEDGRSSSQCTYEPYNQFLKNDRLHTAFHSPLSQASF